MTRKTGLVAALVVLSVQMICAAAWATQFRSGSVVSVRDAEILDDVIAGGDDISLDGHVLGDVIAAGRTVSIGDSAVIDNSFMAFAQKVDVNGTVINSARAFAQDFTLRGHVERNVMVFAQSILIDTRAWVEKDVSFASAQLILRGRVGGNLSGGATTVTISGQIDGDAKIEAEKIVVLQGAIIGGKLRYKSDKEPKIEDGAQILGGVELMTDDEKDKADEGYSLGSFFWDAWWYLGSLALGGVLLVLFRPFMLSISRNITDSTVKTLGLGLLFLICLPIAVVAVILTLIGIPAAILIALLWLILLYLADIFVGLALGNWVITRLRKGSNPRPFYAMAVGLLIVTILCSLPAIGWVVGIAIAGFAMGGFFIAAYSLRSANSTPAS
jgi:cytoskeletal protein CcmA (bactofilin family)